MDAMALLYVMVGGAIGSAARYSAMSLISKLTAGDFPYGTLAVNVLGSMLMGVWIAVVATWLPNRAKDLHLLLAVGVLGGFTTFSAFSLDMFFLVERGLMMEAATYVLSSVIFSLGALMLGMWLTHKLVG